VGADVFAEAGVDVRLGVEGLQGFAGLVEGWSREFVLQVESSDDGF